MEAKRRKAIYFRDSAGNEPAREWLTGLRDLSAKARVYSRIERAEGGNFGDHKGVGEGVLELRIDTGPGYRVYFAIDKNDTVLLLLVGGSKASQSQDISRAKQFWKEHLSGKGK